MIVVGIDPGSNVSGLAVLEFSSADSVPKLLALDYYEAKPKETFEQKLTYITDEILKSLKEFSPDIIILEDVFTGKNIQSALRLAELRGSISYVATKEKIPVQNIPTRIVKKSITGNGNAKKTQVAEYLIREFKLPSDDIPLDATDALALAYHYCLASRIEDLSHS